MGFKIGGFDVGAVATQLARGDVAGAVGSVAKAVGQVGSAVVDAVDVMTGPLQQTKVDMKPGVYGTNGTDTNRPSASGPVSKAEWADPSKLVAKLTQNPAAGATALSHSTCGASNLLGAALLASPEHAARLCANVAKNANDAQLTLPERAELGQIAARIHNQTASYEDLNRAQQLLYKAGNTDTPPDAVVQSAIDGHTLSAAKQSELETLFGKRSWSDDDAKRIGELVTEATGSKTTFTRDGPGWKASVEGQRSNTDTSGYSDSEEGSLARLGGVYTEPSPTPDASYMLSTDVKKLQPGQSMTLRITGDGNDNSGDTQADHYVTVGRRTDGTWYLYNPDPSKGDSTLVVGGKGKAPSGDFMNQVKRYDDRIPLDPNGQMPTPLRFRQE